jgi:hypothetical protein
MKDDLNKQKVLQIDETNKIKEKKLKKNSFIQKTKIKLLIN